MKKMFCRVCGAEILVTFEFPSITYTVEDNALIKEDINTAFDGQKTGLVFHCSDDHDHDLQPRSDELISMEEWDCWTDYVELYFDSKIYPTIKKEMY